MRICGSGMRRRISRAARKLHEQLETAIRSYDKLLIVLSEASLQSAWVQDELRKAFREEYESAGRPEEAEALPGAPLRLPDARALGVPRFAERDRSRRGGAAVFHPGLFALEGARPVRGVVRAAAEGFKGGEGTGRAV